MSNLQRSGEQARDASASGDTLYLVENLEKPVKLQVLDLRALLPNTDHDLSRARRIEQYPGEGVVLYNRARRAEDDEARTKAHNLTIKVGRLDSEHRCVGT